MAQTRTLHEDSRRTQATHTESSVDTDGSGDVTVTISDLREIENPEDVTVTATGGYTADVQSVSGKDVTIRVFHGDYDATADGALIAATNLSGGPDLQITALGR